MLILIFGPTGVGKSEIIRRLVNHRNLMYVTPQMTRPLRLGEIDKEFISEHTFMEREARDAFIIVNHLFGFKYGTPRHLVEAALSTPIPTHVLDFPLEAIDKLDALEGHKVGVLIMPPSKEALVARLTSAGREQRLTQALEQYERYNQALTTEAQQLIGQRVVVNVDIDVAYNEVEQALDRLGLQ